SAEFSSSGSSGDGVPECRKEDLTPATRIMVFSVNCLGERFTLPVRWEATGGSFCPHTFAEIVKETIEATERTGLRVVCVGSDSCGKNQKVWSILSFTNKMSNIRSKIPHPVRPGNNLYLAP